MYFKMLITTPAAEGKEQDQNVKEQNIWIAYTRDNETCPKS